MVTSTQKRSLSRSLACIVMVMLVMTGCATDEKIVRQHPMQIPLEQYSVLAPKVADVPTEPESPVDVHPVGVRLAGEYLYLDLIVFGPSIAAQDAAYSMVATTAVESVRVRNSDGSGGVIELAACPRQRPNLVPYTAIICDNGEVWIGVVPALFQISSGVLSSPTAEVALDASNLLRRYHSRRAYSPVPRVTTPTTSVVVPVFQGVGPVWIERKSQTRRRVPRLSSKK